MKKIILCFLVAVFFLPIGIIHAEKGIWQDEHSYFGEIKNVYLAPITFENNISVNEQNIARANSSIFY